MGNEMRFIPDYDDDPDWQCGTCAQWNKNRWRHCRNCKAPCPTQEAHDLLKKLGEGDESATLNHNKHFTEI